MKKGGEAKAGGTHFLSCGIVCMREHVTWTAAGITVDPLKVGCRRCLRYLADGNNYSDGLPRLSAEQVRAQVGQNAWDRDTGPLNERAA